MIKSLCQQKKFKWAGKRAQKRMFFIKIR